MVKRYIFFLTISLLVLSICQISYAAPAYGTHMPEGHRWTWGVQGNFIMDRNLGNNQGGTDGNRYFLTGSYGVFPWLCFDGRIGVGRVEWKRPSADELDYSTNFAGGYGFRIRGFGNERLGIRSVAGFQHISVHPDARDQKGTKHETIIDEWQGSLIVSKDIGNLVPYLGVRYGSLDFIKWENERDRKRIHSERRYGIITGFDYWLDKKTRVNLEGTFLDGEELAIGISRDF